MWIWEGGVPSRRKVQLLCRCAFYGFFRAWIFEASCRSHGSGPPRTSNCIHQERPNQISKEETLLRKPMHNSERLPT